jgi:pimeloyl-ACP methyl ester carboxylesterase
VILVDLPGHGRSALPAGRLTIERMAAEVDALLARLGEPSVHVVGLSLGACVALALTARAPARVRSLTLVNAFVRLRPADTQAALRLALRGFLLASAPMTAVGALVARTVFPRPEQAALREAAAARVAGTSRRSYLAAASAIAGFDARVWLGDVRCPVMVVAGIDDRTVDIDAKHALARAIAGARLVLVAGSGHVTNVDQPVAFNAVLREFLAAC